jgi:four helix bundle protein
VKSYEDLDVWQEAMALVEVVYGVSSSFPSDERFGLTSQLRRAAVSVPSNIAEGHARASTRDFLRFLSISMGSLAETRTQLLIAKRMRFVEPAACDRACEHTDRVGRMLRGLMKALNARLAIPVPNPLPPTP